MGSLTFYIVHFQWLFYLLASTSFICLLFLLFFTSLLKCSETAVVYSYSFIKLLHANLLLSFVYT